MYPNEQQQQERLIRSKNFLDLHDDTHDEQQHLLNLSSATSCQQHQPPLTRRRMGDQGEEEDEEESRLENEGYANVDTQTSFCDEPEAAEADEAEGSEFGAGDEEQADEGGGGDHDDHDGDLQQLGDEQKLNMLRDLLATERQRNEQRRANNQAMQEYVMQLQDDYLRLQRDLVETLELGLKIKAQKQAQIETLNETIRERDKLVEQLKSNLASLDENKVREEFRELMGKQNQLAQIEKQQLREQIATVEQQLVHERVSNSQLLQQFQIKLEDQLGTHEKETETLRKKLADREAELEKLLREPKNLVIRSLREEKSGLACQVDELSMLLTESQTKYELLRKRIESLIEEQEHLEEKNREEIDKLQEQYNEQRRVNQEKTLELDDKEEVVQILQFNLERSERRVKNLLAALKSGETTYQKMIDQLQLKHEKELEKTQNALRVLERKLVETTTDIDSKQNELVRIELEQSNQLESIRNDRDQRVGKLIQEKQRIEKELQSIEIHLAHELEDKENKQKLIDQLKREVQKFKDEGKRLSLELATSQAKLFSKQQELGQIEREQATAQRQTSQQQVSNFELEEAQRHARRLQETVDELKRENEKMAIKLRLNETNMSRINAAISQEHAKLVHDYEKKLEQIRGEQGVYDRNRSRYKRYGHKLKKYCEHLRRVHEHLCNPTVCGYSIGGPAAATGQQQHHSAPLPIKRSSGSRSEDKALLVPNREMCSIFSSDDEEDTTEPGRGGGRVAFAGKENKTYPSTPPRSMKRREGGGFSIKRTGFSPSTGQPDKSSARNSSTATTAAAKKSILKSIGNQQTQHHQPPQSPFSMPLDHNYYYINEDSFVGTTTTTAPTSPDVCRVLI